MERCAYELAREATIAGNKAKLAELGLEATAPPKAPPRPRTPKAAKARAEPTRASKRVRQEAAPEPLPLPDEPPSPSDDAPPPPKRRRAVERPQPTAESPMIGNVRRFVEENLPDDHVVEERRMFGMCMWLVRGNMFLGVGLNSDRMLLRVGEPAVEAVRDGASKASSHAHALSLLTAVAPGTLCSRPVLNLW